MNVEPTPTRVLWDRHQRFTSDQEVLIVELPVSCRLLKGDDVDGLAEAVGEALDTIGRKAVQKRLRG